MARYLRGASELRPVAVDGSRAPAADEARVTAKLAHGEVFLKDDSGAVLRLVWSGDGESRAVPAGRYRLFGYRIVDGDWMISATGGKRAVELKAGAELALAIDPRVHVEVAAMAGGAERALNVSVRGNDGLGLSVYRDGRRIELPFVVERGEEALVKGNLAYG